MLAGKASYEFKALFTVVHANLKARNAANGGEEMLRLRAYEKLQNLVTAGVVKKTGREYQGIPKGLASYLAVAAEFNAKFAAAAEQRQSAKSAPAA